MPLYSYRCPQCGGCVDALRAVAERDNAPRCAACYVILEGHLHMVRVPTAGVQLNPPTGAALRSQFGLYKEATAEIDHAYTKVETVEERSIQAPNLWGQAKERAQAMVAAGEAPSMRQPE